jgi:4-azaleucine resistance transporter AzlC
MVAWPVSTTTSSSPPPDIGNVTFSFSGFLDGIKLGLPIALSVFAYGLVFGILAQQAGLSLLEAVLMSLLVYAGSAQFVVLGLWTNPLPVATIVVTTLIVNLRHVLMGAALSPWFSRLRPSLAFGTLFFMSDESWALTVGHFGRGRRDGAFLLGCGLLIYLAWVSATVVGRALGSHLQDPARLGLDFAFTAVFLALLVGLWKGRADILPWLSAALVAVLAAHWLPGKWYILLGAFAGSLLGALRYDA